MNAFQTDKDSDIILVSSIGKTTRLKASDISIIGRATQGVKLMKVNDKIKIVAVAKIADNTSE